MRYRGEFDTGQVGSRAPGEPGPVYPDDAGHDWGDTSLFHGPAEEYEHERQHWEQLAGKQEPAGWRSRPADPVRGRTSGNPAWMGSPGPYAGRGPKGYQRSSERIREDVCDALSRHGEVDATDIEIQVEQGEVTLTGFVAERRQKRLAEDAAAAVRGVIDVHNRLWVRQAGTQAAGPWGRD